MLIYLLSHNFLYKFGDVDEVGSLSITLGSVSVKTSIFSKGVTCAVLKQDGKLPSWMEQLTIFVIGIKNTLIQLRTKDVGI